MFTLEKRAHFPDCNWSLVAELASSHLEEEDGESHEDQRDDVRDEERTSAIPVIAQSQKLSKESKLSFFQMQMTLPVAEIGKPPDVAEADGESKTREQELDRIVPAAAVLVHRRVFAEVVVMKILRSVILGQAGLCLHIKKLRYCILGFFLPNVLASEFGMVFR